ncbi:MAG: PAS domain-containing sensor histidine kinase [Rhodospirillales bacterium]|nr:PAS domain-containing sensor histidine kinase [Rhodospirillales bacterium]
MTSTGAMYPLPAASEIASKGGQLITGLGGAVTDAKLQATLARVVMQELSPVFIAYLEGNLLYANSGYLRLFGIAPHGATDIDVHLAELRHEVGEVMTELRGPSGRLVAQRSFPTPSGQAHYRVQYFPVFDGGDRLVAIGGVYYEITAQVTTVERLRATQETFNDILRSASDWVWETDENDRISFISERITEIIGQPTAIIVGRRLADLGVPTEEPGGAAAFQKALTARTPFRSQTLDMPGRDGRLRRHHLSGVPIFHLKSGRFAGFRGTGTDVSAQYVAEEASRISRRQLEEALGELNRKNLHLDLALGQAQVAAKAKGEFLANMSHELRTPLNAVIGFADLIAQRSFGPNVDRYVEYASLIVKAGNHLLSIVNDILDASRLESNLLRVDLEPAGLASIIDEALSLVAARATEKRIVIAYDSATADMMLMVDRVRAVQIFVNLLSNGVKFTPAGGRVGIDIGQMENGQARIVVWDTGPGVPVDKHEAIFAPFYQIHEHSYSRPHEGAGLGLPISRQLARLMNGDVAVEGAAGQGARFAVNLPMATNEAIERTAARQRAAARPDESGVAG